MFNMLMYSIKALYHNEPLHYITFILQLIFIHIEESWNSCSNRITFLLQKI